MKPPTPTIDMATITQIHQIDSTSTLLTFNVITILLEIDLSCKLVTVTFNLNSPTSVDDAKEITPVFSSILIHDGNG